MTELGWLYEVIGALDELIQVSGDVLEPDERALGSAMGWADLMNRFQDAISRADNAASDIPNLLQWSKTIQNTDETPSWNESERADAISNDVDAFGFSEREAEAFLSTNRNRSR